MVLFALAAVTLAGGALSFFTRDDAAGLSSGLVSVTSRLCQSTDCKMFVLMESKMKDSATIGIPLPIAGAILEVRESISAGVVTRCVTLLFILLAVVAPCFSTRSDIAFLDWDNIPEKTKQRPSSTDDSDVLEALQGIM